MSWTEKFKSFLYARPWRLHTLALLAFIAGTTIAFMIVNVAHFTFDDYSVVVLNPSIRDFKGLPTVLSSGRPIRGLTLMLDYALFEMDPRGYHLHNFLWHFLSTALLYALVYRISGRVFISFAAAMTFAVHPVHAEAVMVISHRKELLALCFLLLSYHSFLYRNRGFYLPLFSCVIFFLLGVLSKQVVIVLPLIFAVHAWLEKGGGAKTRDAWHVLAPAAIGALLVAGSLLVSGPVVRDFNPFGLVSPIDLQDQGYARVMATSFAVFPRHLQYLFTPVHMSAAPKIEISQWSELDAWLGLAVFFLAAYAVVRTRRDFMLSLSLAWILINLAPIMNWVPSNAFFAERYLYIPSTGACLLIACLCEKLYTERGELFSSRSYWVISFVLLLMLLFLVLNHLFAHRINAVWPPAALYLNDRATAVLFASAMVSLPGAALISGVWSAVSGRLFERRAWLEFMVVYAVVALAFIGTAAAGEAILTGQVGLPYMDAQMKFTRLESWLSRHAAPGPRGSGTMPYPYGDQAVEAWNLFFHAFGTLSLFVFALSRLYRWGRIKGFNKGVACQVLLLVVFSMMVEAEFRAGDWSSELRLWKSAVMEDPGSLLGWNNLGKAYMDRRRFDLAARAFGKAADLYPDKSRVHANLGMALLAEGDLEGSLKAYKKALKLNPADILSRMNLANILVTLGEREGGTEGCRKAIPHYLEVIERDPRSARARYNLAFCYYRLGALREARSQLIKSLSIDPASKKSRELLSKVKSAMSDARH